MRVETARHIFGHSEKSGSLHLDSVWRKRSRHVRYNRRWTILRWVFPCDACCISLYPERSEKVAADACYYYEIGLQSYVKLFQVVNYDANNHLLLLGFAHLVSFECKEYWAKVLEEAKALQGFDVPTRITIVSQKNFIEAEYLKNGSRKAFPRPTPCQKEHGIQAYCWQIKWLVSIGSCCMGSDSSGGQYHCAVWARAGKVPFLIWQGWAISRIFSLRSHACDISRPWEWDVCITSQSK